MTESVAAEAAIGETIQVADLLDLVRKHAEEGNWCEEVERYLVMLGLEFAYDPANCWCEMCAPDEPARFTLAPDSPSMVDKPAVIELMSRLVKDGYEETSVALRAEAAERLGLKVEAVR